DDQVSIARRELGDDRGALCAGDRVWREHLELGVARKMVVCEVDDRLSCAAGARDLFLNDGNDAGHRRTAIEGAALVDEVFDHVDDDERSFHQRPGTGSQRSMETPRCAPYQSASASTSGARKKTPPRPVTREGLVGA